MFIYSLVNSGLHTDRRAEEPVSVEGYVEEGVLGLSREVEGRILSSSVTRDLLLYLLPSPPPNNL